MKNETGAPLLELRDVKTYFKVSGGVLKAVNGVSLTIHEGETIGLVGESGCGKSTLGKTILRLIRPAGGQVLFDGQRVRIASPMNIRPKQGENRSMFLFRQGELDLRFVDKTLDLKKLVQYGYVEDLGYEPIDQSQGGDKSKLFPVHEVAIITSENKRYHMNAGIYSKKQRYEIFTQMRQITGIEPEGKLAEELKQSVQ